MKEIVSQIETLLANGTNMTPLHELHKNLELPPEIFWMAVNLCLDFRLWTGELAGKHGQEVKPEVIKYLINLSTHVRHQLYILKNKPFGN